MANKNVTDMTVGNPTRHILKFTLPLLIGNLFQQLYNMVDSIVVGRYVSAHALAAVGACGSLNFLFFSLSSGLSVGIGIIAAQYFGANDEKQLKKTIANSIYVLSSAAIVVTLIGVLFARPILQLLQTPDVYISDSIDYFRVTCIGIIGVAFYNGVAALLRAVGDSKTPLYFLILSSIINVVLDLLFVICFGMGVVGVGLATIIAQAVSAVVSMIYAYHKVSYFRLGKKDLHPDISMIRDSFRLGAPVAFQNSMIAVSCIALQAVVNGFGPDVASAYTITGRIEQLVQQPYGSLGMALTSYAGQNIGAKKQERVVEGFRKATLIVLIFSLIMLPLFFFFGKYICAIFVKEEAADVIALGAKALRITSPFYFALGMIYVPRAVLNGCGDTGFAMINGLTEVVCRILFSNILTRIAFLDYWGIWITTGLTWGVTALVCVIRYRGGKWRYKALEH
ncbi:MAG: MATE family efflux transporter [Clostridiales bacterium]|nr:MATE family efflux transporter [Clostridiales bacterium]MBQ6270441.1 MATE family efflux transporter [Clostridiales bacterium]